MNSSQSNSINFLRALAVISVILYHTKLEFFSAGYLGVDIFFFISGYLMMRIFSFEKYSIKKFLLRRFFRIFPALITMLVFVYIFSLFFLPPLEFKDLLESIIANIFLVPSHYFLIKNSDYFSSISSEVPLIHTWSLGIEYFFYLFIAILFFFLKERYLNKNKFFYLIFFIFIISLFISQMGGNLNKSYPLIYLPFISPEFKFDNPLLGNFYLYSSRIWEFLFGILMYLLQRKNLFKPLAKYSSLIFITGTILILISFKIFKKIYLGPSFFTLIPLLGASLILISEYKSQSFVDLFIKNKIITYLATISFSLYLYHQPIFAFFRIRNYELIKFEHWFILLPIVIIVSHFSYIYVEKTFKKDLKIQSTFSIYTLTCLIFLLFYSIGDIRPVDSKYLKYLNNFNYNNPDMKRCRNMPLNSLCNFGDKNSKYKAIAWGDSHLDQLVPLIDSLTKKNNFSFLEIVRTDCPPILNLERSDIRSDNCTKEADKIVEYINKVDDIDVLIMNAWWEKYIDMSDVYSIKNNSVLDEIENTIKKFNDKKLIIITAIPSKKINPKKNYLRSIFYKEKIYNILNQDSLDNHITKTKKSNDFFMYLKQKYKNIYLLNPEQHLCKNQKCKSIENGMILYRDRTHIGLDGSMLLKNELNNLLKEIFK